MNPCPKCEGFSARVNFMDGPREYLDYVRQLIEIVNQEPLRSFKRPVLCRKFSLENGIGIVCGMIFNVLLANAFIGFLQTTIMDAEAGCPWIDRHRNVRGPGGPRYSRPGGRRYSFMVCGSVTPVEACSLIPVPCSLLFTASTPHAQRKPPLAPSDPPPAQSHSAQSKRLHRAAALARLRRGKAPD